MRKSLILIPGAILLLLAALAGTGWFYLRHNITPEAMAEIHPGMARAQVEAILGGPPGSYNRWHGVLLLRSTTLSSSLHHGDDWIADDCIINVHFDSADRVDRVEDRSDFAVYYQCGFYLNGQNIMPEFLRGWLGWDSAEPWTYKR